MLQQANVSPFAVAISIVAADHGHISLAMNALILNSCISVRIFRQQTRADFSSLKKSPNIELKFLFL